jgi:Pectate lyase superfamily protein
MRHTLASNSAETADGSDEPSRTTTRDGTPMERRKFLQAAGVTTTGLVLASGGASASERDIDVVNIVTDYGADPTGEEPINEAMDAALGDGASNVKVIFPSGTYWVDGTLAYSNLDSVSLVGQGDVSIVPTEGYVGHTFILVGSDVAVSGFVFDYRKPETKASVLLTCDDGLLLKDVLFRGVRDVRAGMNHCFYTTVTDPEGSGLVENVHCPDGAKEMVRQGGTWVPNLHAGRLLFKRCSFERFTDNALYASGVSNDNQGGQHGAVCVENCYFHNNNISSIRLGSPESYAKNSTVIVDDADGGPPPLYPHLGGIVNARAVWLWYDFDGSIKNCDIVIDHPKGSGILWYERENAGKSATVKNTRIQIDADAPSSDEYAGEPIYLWGIWARAEGDPLEFKNVSITGSAPGYTAVKVADREARFENCCIHQTSEDRDGITFEDASGLVRNTTLNVTGDPIANENSDVETEHIQTDGVCSRPI